MISHGTKVASPSYRDQLIEQRSGLVNDRLWQNILKYLGIGAGVGLVGRGAQGLYNMGRRSLTVPPALNTPKTISVPVEEEDEKLAFDLITPVKDFFAGENASDWKGHPFAIPGQIAGTGAGVIGGWKLMDYILDKQRKAEQEGELEKAKKEYEAALVSQHKQGSALGQDLDRLFDLLQEKKATLGDTAGQIAGMAMVPMGALAIASGLITHNIASKRRQKALLEKAMAKRRREQQQVSPTRIYAMPQPMAPKGLLNAAPSEDEMDGNPLDKAAMEKEAYPPGMGPLSSSRGYYQQNYAGGTQANLARSRYGRRPAPQQQQQPQQQNVAQQPQQQTPVQRSAYRPQAQPGATPGGFRPRRPPTAAAKPPTGGLGGSPGGSRSLVPGAG